jgi:hypothetical protein
MYLKQLQDISNEQTRALVAFADLKRGETRPLWEKLQPLQDEARQLNILVRDLQARVTEERVLGAPLTPGKANVTGEKSDGKTDWARVIENNITRVGAILTMFFLVTILVPQYRYNIRMAGFYAARADSFTLLPKPTTSPDDLIKVVTVMTPDIDFGKAPPTPWQQIIEAKKRLRVDPKHQLKVTSPLV